MYRHPSPSPISVSAFAFLAHLPPTSHQMAVSKPISAIYEPGAPPPSIPVLTYQTKFMSPPNKSPSILTQDVPTQANKQPPSQNKFENPPTKNIHFTSPAESSESNSSQSSPDDRKSVLSDKEDDGLIPKPQGEAQRPNCGGYNLKLELSWDVE